MLLVWSGAAHATGTSPLAFGVPFTDYLVLQRDRTVPIWGVGTPGTDILVTLNTVQARARVDDHGHWRAVLPPLAVTRDAALSVRSSTGETQTLRHVAVGDVWLCSGQSNMEFTVRQATNADQELAQSEDSDLRLFLVPRQRLPAAADHLARPSRWLAANADSAREFSAVCYYMGRELRERLGIPIGLIAASWGGSRIEDWIAEPALRRLGGFDDDLAAVERHRVDPAGTERIANAVMERWLQSRRPQRTVVPVSVRVSRPWEQSGIAELADFDGLAVYRTTVTLTAEQATAARAVVIGNVDDIDLTLVNAVRVGTMAGWDRPRNYALSAPLVHAGVNEIEVVVLDTGGGGGLWGNGERGIRLADNSIVPFGENWTLTRGQRLADLGPAPMAPWVNGEGLATLHNGMIEPLGNYAVHGIAWYQGESNVARASAYPALLSALVDDWRSRFATRQVLLVQLAGFGALPDAVMPSAWAELREAQRIFANANQDVALVPAMDIGDRFDIHPTNKREVGRRLALAASSSNWNSGAELAIVRSANSLELRLPQSFRLLGGAAHPTGFATCDGEGRCQFVDAQLIGTDRITIPITIATHEIRYLWSNNALVSLFDENGVPLAPFRIIIAQHMQSGG